MKFSVRSVLWLLPLLACGCTHKPTSSQMQALAPPIEDAPPPKADSAPAIPAPVATIPNPGPPPALATQHQPPKPLPKHKKPAPKNAALATTPATPPQPTQQASVATSEVSAIGQFTPGDKPDVKKQNDAISGVEHDLNGITRKLTDQEEKTSTQIKEYLKQARTALASGDVEGANTLTAKAKVLLGELSQ